MQWWKSEIFTSIKLQLKLTWLNMQFKGYQNDFWSISSFLFHMTMPCNLIFSIDSRYTAGLKWFPKNHEGRCTLSKSFRQYKFTCRLESTIGLIVLYQRAKGNHFENTTSGLPWDIYMYYLVCALISTFFQKRLILHPPNLYSCYILIHITYWASSDLHSYKILRIQQGKPC